MKEGLRRLYLGSDRLAAGFQIGLLILDILTIGYFLTVTFVHEAGWTLTVDLLIALFLILDFAARIVISNLRWRYLFEPVTLADLVVIVSLLAPLLVENLAFLRILRTVRILRSYHVLGQLKRQRPWFRRNDEMIQSVVNLLVFIFTVTAIVYVNQVGSNPEINNYIDALYFTVATLTTTGFGDITLIGEGGRLLAILIMIFGISLFLRLVQTIFRPAKVRHTCGECGLMRHDPDAVHCKHCGDVLNIPSEGS